MKEKEKNDQKKKKEKARMHVHAASFIVIAEERFTVTLVNKFEDLILSAIIIYVD